MKKLCFALFTLFSVPGFTQSPITIYSSNMPAVGDTFRYEVVPNFLTSIDLTQTGPGITWDFSSMMSVMNYLDEYVSVQSTGLIYNVMFWTSDHALRLNTPDSLGQGQIPMQDIYNFYKVNTSDYEISGFGATIMGAPIPVPYTFPDVLYTFPLTYGTADSSVSGFNFTIPNMGSYSRWQKRVNYADGWGILITPKGSFEVLRVVSHIYRQDTLVSNQGTLGFPVHEIEYKWLSNKYPVPVLQVNAQEILGQVIPYRAVYLGVVDSVITGLVSPKTGEVTLYPNPAGEITYVQTYVEQPGTVAIELLDVSGKLLQQQVSQTTGAGNQTIPVSLAGLASGSYWIRIQTGNTVKTLPLMHY